ncbi:MAG: hypothetical protein JWM76_2153 [Pseudonocardiales bacterium]|nr:hypothetical protein [Pseudonocardiales bacterium]
MFDIYGGNDAGGRFAAGGSAIGPLFYDSFSADDDVAVASVEMLPSRLARAAADVLPVEGVGLSVFSVDYRVPLGASSALACDAERLQFTYGEGPCLQAYLSAVPMRASSARVEASWPLFYGDLIAHTPYRSVVALPLRRVAPNQGGALDLYLSDPLLADSLDLEDALTVAELIVDILTLAESDDDPAELPGPAWLHGPAAQRRMQIWVAVGMINVALHRHDDDALALLRAYAFGNSETVDAVAQAVVDREIPIEALQAG